MSLRPPRPPSLPLVNVNTIMMQEFDKSFNERVGLCLRGVEESWHVHSHAWSRGE